MGFAPRRCRFSLVLRRYGESSHEESCNESCNEKGCHEKGSQQDCQGKVGQVFCFPWKQSEDSGWPHQRQTYKKQEWQNREQRSIGSIQEKVCEERGQGMG